MSDAGDQGRLMDAEQREALTRQSVEAWNAEDWEEQLRAIWDPEGLIVAPEGWPEPGTFRGWPAMLGQWRRIKGSWANERAEVISVETHGDRAIAQLRWVLQGEASGAPLEVDAWLVCGFREDRLSRMEYFLEHDAARRAAKEAL